MKTLSVPPRAHPLVREFYRMCIDRDLVVKDVAKISGVPISTIENWRNVTTPKVSDLEACFNAIGYRLVPRIKPVEA
jgi:predicted transcriptional regulator